MLASAVLDEAAGLLNDQARATFTYTNMLPYLSKANDELETQLALNGVSILKQQSAVSTINIGTALLPLPVDLLTPLEMWERLAGTAETYVSMDEVDFPPEEIAGPDLRFWAYENLLLKIGPANSAGALTAREVKLNYTRLLTSITSQASAIEVQKSKTFLAERTAGLAARFIGENGNRADVLDTWALGPNRDFEGGSIADCVRIFVRNNQGFGVRRKGYKRPRLLVR